MSLDLMVPSYVLPEDNIFTFREGDFASQLVQNVTKMLLAGEPYGIRVKDISITRPNKADVLEIRQTTSKILRIVIGVGEDKEIDLVYDIPWLINNHFYIGGNKKISIYQLFDKPLIVKDNIAKVRTNIHSFTLIKRSKRKYNYNYYLTVFNKELPFCFVLVAAKGVDACKQEFELGPNGEIKEIADDALESYNLLRADVSDVIQNISLDHSRLFKEFFMRKLDSEIISNIYLVTEVDIFSKSFMNTDNVIDEFIWALKNISPDDGDYSNKRIRFSEQLIYSYLCKDFYTMISALKSSKKTRFCNNSKVILSNANTSPIVQFDFSINPLSELAMLTRTSLSGPGGFEKTTVPAYLRDIHSSMFGRVCPADTGDRENCGTIQYLVPTIEFNDDFSFSDPKEYCKNSVSISHVPFLERDDATRLQMSSSQQRHAIMLQKFDVPLIQSGIEGMYSHHTSFIFKADRDGKVVFKDDSVIIVQYDNKVCKAFNIGYKKLYLSVVDFYKTRYDIGDKFKKGDIISESNYFADGRLTIGKNLVTAVMVWHGYNFEDGIVISDKLVKDDTFTSMHYLDLSFEISPNKVLLNLNDDNDNYKPLPQIGDVLKRGDVFAKIKTVSGLNDSTDVIFDTAQERTVSEDCIITDVQIFVNKCYKEINQYSDFVKSFIENKRTYQRKMIETLSQFLTQDELENFLEGLEIDKTEKGRRGNYKVKGESIDGILVQITAMYKRPITVGDKIGNRHGNKGIISKIVPHEQMPRSADGRIAEVIINPLGIPSRMNTGQLFELHLALSVEDLKNRILAKVKEDKIFTYAKLKKYVLDYIKIIDNTKDHNYTEQMKTYLNSITLETFIEDIDKFYVIQPPYESIEVEQLFEAMKYTGTELEFPCFDPTRDEEGQKDLSIFKQNIVNEIAFGYMYFIKMNHIAKDKLAARGVGPYTSKTSQPLDGKGRKGGQRTGEMEVWAIAAQGANQNLHEFLTTKSDSIRKRNMYISEMIHNDDMLLDDNDDSVSQAIRLFQSDLKAIGLDYHINEEG